MKETSERDDVFALAALAGMVPFAAAARHGLVAWDDPAMAGAANPLLESLDLAHLGAMWTSGHMTSWQPLGWLAYAALRAAFGPSGAAVHAAMIVLHGLNAFLALRLLEKAMPKLPTWAALAAVAAWAAHPTRTEAVVWAAQLSDLLCAACVLLALAAHAEEERKGALGWALLAALFRWKAVMVLPLACGVDLLRGRRPGAALAWLAPGAVLAAAAAAWAKGAGGYGAALRPHEASAGLLLHLARQFVPRRLAPGLTSNGIDNPLRLPFGQSLAGVLLSAAAAAVSPLALWGLAAFAACLAPVLLVVGAGPVAAFDHHAYLAALAFVPALAAGLSALEDRARAGRWAGAVLVCALAVLSMRQTSFWSDTETLWTRALSVSPRVYAARPNLAEYYAAAGRPGAALVMLDEHLALYPDDVVVRSSVVRFFDAYAPLTEDRPRLWADAAREARALGRPDEAARWERLILKNGMMRP